MMKREVINDKGEVLRDTVLRPFVLPVPLLHGAAQYQPGDTVMLAPDQIQRCLDVAAATAPFADPPSTDTKEP